jgi:hypothetical protein
MRGVKGMNVKQLTKEILAISNADVGSLPVKQMIAWHPQKTPDEVSLLLTQPGLKEEEKTLLIEDLKPTMIQQGRPFPLKPSAGVYALFEGDPLRVYVVEQEIRGGDAEQENRGGDVVMQGSRFNLSATSRVFSVDVMTLETFKAEIAREWEELDAPSAIEDLTARVEQLEDLVLKDEPEEAPKG